MVDPVLVVLEEIDGMSPQGMAALAALFKEISETPREFQPVVCVCNDTAKLKKYRLMAYVHGHLFEPLPTSALFVIAERNGFASWNTPRLASIVGEARGDARHLLHALALDNHRRSLAPKAQPTLTPSLGERAEQSRGATLAATVDGLFRQAQATRRPSVDAALGAYRLGAHAVAELVAERYTSHKTVADIDAVFDDQRRFVERPAADHVERRKARVVVVEPDATAARALQQRAQLARTETVSEVNTSLVARILKANGGQLRGGHSSLRIYTGKGWARKRWADCCRRRFLHTRGGLRGGNGRDREKKKKAKIHLTGLHGTREHAHCR